MLFFFSAQVIAQKINLLPATIRYCYGDSANVEIKQQLDNEAIIHWSTPMGIITNTRKVNATKAGKYSVRISSPKFTSPLTDSTFVMIYYKVRPLLRDTVICKGKRLVLDARYPEMRFFWNTGETSQKITVDNPGRYWVKIINGSCETVDSVRVRQVLGAGTALPTETVFCINDQEKLLTVRTNPGVKILWNTGATTNTVQVSKEGYYRVRAETAMCGAQLDSVRVKFKVCECEMMIPNSFTPNEDNRNDYFFPVVQCDYSHFNITITDRWGNTVYYSNAINGKWDGRFKGNLCPEDIYIYRIESTERGGEKKQVRQGQISLFR